MCGGTIIDKKWILTSASCFDYYSPSHVNAFNVKNLYAIAGTKVVNDKGRQAQSSSGKVLNVPAGSKQGEAYEVEAVIHHPDYRDE